MELTFAKFAPVRLRAFPAPLHRRGLSSFEGGCHGEKRPSSSTVRCSRNLVGKTGTGTDERAVRTSIPSFRKLALFPLSETFSAFSGQNRRENRLFTHSGVSAPVPDDGEGAAEPVVELQSWERKAEKIGEALSSAFPLWVALACVLALVWPGATGWIDQRVQVFGITVTMLGMGMTLTPKDFQGAFLMSRELLAGIILQYTVMPASGYFVSRLLQLPPHYAAGLILAPPVIL